MSTGSGYWWWINDNMDVVITIGRLQRIKCFVYRLSSDFSHAFKGQMFREPSPGYVNFNMTMVILSIVHD